MNPNLSKYYINASATGISILFLTIILVSSLMHKKERLSRRPFCICTALLLLLLTIDCGSRILEIASSYSGRSPFIDNLLRIFYSLDFLIYSMLDDFFFLYLIASVEEKRTVSPLFMHGALKVFRLGLSTSLLSSLLFIRSFWTGFFFISNEQDIFMPLPWYSVLVVLSSLISIANMALMLRQRKYLGIGKTISCLLYILIPLGLTYVDISYDLTSSYISCAIVMTIIYITVDLKQDEELLNREAAYAKSQSENTTMHLKLMMSQIQPHFLYNSLSSIAYLCRKNPKEAELAVNEFSDYLRMNLRSINSKRPIPFEEELSHVEIFLKLQKRRFPDQIQVEESIEVRDFPIPALTLQPIVENAVKYAVETRFEPTTIRICSREKDGAYVVTVEDNGPGFDFHQKTRDDRPHVGIVSARSQLSNMLGGSLDIHSEPRAGTIVTITIPKEKGDCNHDNSCSR
ncbi:MAG: histidine kinase [Lachnospiraceae bacterium]|nr:histidine kinase [Lachnospiraceae bacterium]